MVELVWYFSSEIQAFKGFKDSKIVYSIQYIWNYKHCHNLTQCWHSPEPDRYWPDAVRIDQNPTCLRRMMAYHREMYIRITHLVVVVGSGNFHWGMIAAVMKTTRRNMYHKSTDTICLSYMENLYIKASSWKTYSTPGSKVHGANMGIQSAPDGPHVGPMILAIRKLSPTCFLS